MLEEEVVVHTTVAHAARWPVLGVQWQRLGIEDAELLVEPLCDLSRQLYQVAAVDSAVRPVEPVGWRRKKRQLNNGSALLHFKCLQSIYPSTTLVYTGNMAKYLFSREYP